MAAKKRTHAQNQAASLLGQHTKELNRRKKQRMLINDVQMEGDLVVAVRGEAKVLSTHPQQSWFRNLVNELEEMRIEYLAPSLDLVDTEWRSKAEQILRCPPEQALKVKQTVLASVHLAVLSAWKQGRIAGKVTELSLTKSADKMDKLAAWRERSGDEDVSHIQARADAFRATKPEEVLSRFKEATKKEYDMSKIPVSMQATLKKFVDNGGSVLEEALAGLQIDPKTIKAMMAKKLIEQPSVGLYRLIEKVVVKEPTPEKKAEAEAVAKPAKPPKEPKPPKEKKPRAEKPKINPSELCLCGCSEKVPATSRFRPGHDAKLHSLVLKTIKAQKDKDALAKLAKDSPARLEPKGEQGKLQLAYLKAAPWMDDATKKGIKEFGGVDLS